jgi:hypothetical protein
MQQTGIKASTYRVSNDIAFNIILDLITAIKRDAVDTEKVGPFQGDMLLLLRDIDEESGKALAYVERFHKDEEEAA